MTDIRMHSIVALLQDIPGERLVRGQVGRIVEIWSPGVYDVAFSDGSGKVYAMVTVKAEQLLLLHYPPAHLAA